MATQIDHHNEQLAAHAFSKQAIVFDELYGANTIVQYKRLRVRQSLLSHLRPASRILELNAGTGDDAIYLAQSGHSVHATDIAAGMQEQLVKKVITSGLQSKVTNELCSYTCLEQLQAKGPYDCIFSNFAGLNCTGDLTAVLDSFHELLQPNGVVVLVMLPGFCLWETLLVFKGKFKTAMRRFFSRSGRIANIDGAAFTCWYYSPKFITRHLRDQFTVLGIEGLCTIVPPSYIEHFAEKHPSSFSFLRKMEDRYKTRWPWKYIGDYFILVLKKKP